MQQEQNTIDLHGLTLLVGVCAWVAGILLAYTVHLSEFLLLVGAAATLIFIILLWHERQSRLSASILLCLLLGAWRCSHSLPANDPLAQTLSHAIGNSLTIRGCVSEEPKLYGNNHLLSITVSSISQDKGTTWQEADEKLTVVARGTAIEDPYGANYGSIVELQGKLSNPLAGSAPDTLANMLFPRIRVTANAGNPLLAALFSWRITLSNIIEQVLPQPDAAVLVAILLGLRTPDLHPLVHLFQTTGTVHIIVASGFKVTLLAGIVASSTRWLRRSKIEQGKLLPAQKRSGWQNWLSMSLILASITAYTILSGAGAAAIRSGVMGSLIVIAPRMGRTYNVYTALAFTAFLMSLIDPFVLWDVGFQLSFLGTLGIVLFTPYFHRPLLRIARFPLGYMLSEMFAVTLAAEVATLPILAIDFQLVSWIAPFTNTIVVPLLAEMIMLGGLVCAIGLVSLPLAKLASWVVWPFLEYIVRTIQWHNSIWWAATPIPPFNSAIIWCYYALLTVVAGFVLIKWPISKEHTIKQDLLLGLSKRAWRLIQVSMALFLIAFIGVNEYLNLRSTPDMTLTFLPVASKGQLQGDALLIRTPDHKTILINGGPDISSLAQELDARLPLWQRSLDAVILTDPRQDHITGLLDIVQRYKIGVVIDAGMLHPDTTYTRWRRTISERNISYLTARQSNNFQIGNSVSLQVLWPPAPLHKGSNEVRDNSLILRIWTPTLRLLLLGTGAQSKFALSGLLGTIDPISLQAEIVQMVEEANTPFPEELDNVLQSAHPTCLLMTPSAISKKVQTGTPSTKQKQRLPAQARQWQSIPTQHTAQIGSFQINTNQRDWCVNTV